MMWILLSLALIAGALSGSFLCLTIERFPICASSHIWLQRLFRPASRCDNCHHFLKLADLVPLLSWLWLRGHCRYCQHPVSGYSFCIEFISAMALTLLVLFCHASGSFAWICIFCSTALVLSEIDRRHLLLPDALTLPLLWTGLLFNMQLSQPHLQLAVSGAIFGYLALGLLRFCYSFFLHREGLGGGDVKYFSAIGAWIGLDMLPVVATLAACTGVISYLIHRTFRYNLRYLPFGPSLSFAAVLVLIEQYRTPDFLAIL